MKVARRDLLVAYFVMVSSLAYSSTLKTEPKRFFKISLDFAELHSANFIYTLKCFFHE
jgi:hypothetical protein